MRNVHYLLLQASQASPRLNSSETQATGAVCFAARLSVCSISSTESTVSTITALKESLKTDVKRYYILYWSFPL